MNSISMILTSITILSAVQAPAEDQSLPAVDWARETLRQKIAAYQGVPVDDYTPMPCILIQWDQALPRINGERCWFAFFRYEGKNAFLRGHGETVIQAAAMAEGFVSQIELPADVQQRLQAQREAAMEANHQRNAEIERQARKSIQDHEREVEEWRRNQDAKNKAETAKEQAQFDAEQDAEYVSRNNNETGVLTRLGLKNQNMTLQIAAEKEWLAHYHSTHSPE
jgi:hypothetical protein